MTERDLRALLEELVTDEDEREELLAAEKRGGHGVPVTPKLAGS